MKVMLPSSLFAMMLSVILIIVGKILGSMSPILESEKKSSFECGFDPLSIMRTPFSTRFFLLAVIFLIFDIEIVLLLPILFLWKQKCNLFLIGSLILFLIILLIGVFHEWKEGSLDWAKEF
uniref:NADH-ubiquinone oxidoreductase chain 3 n=1 Tax=Valvata hokkaidoensis TaxID=96458 RepID=A0A7R7YCH0_9GAST|nr:ND3 [Valvata hokkaidoensis]